MTVTGYEDCCIFSTLSAALLTSSGIKCTIFLTFIIYYRKTSQFKAAYKDVRQWL